MRKTVAELQGAYALAVVSETDPECIVVAREGCPVVIGLGIDENFVASDVAALLPVTRRFMFLEEGDVAEIRRKSVHIVDAAGARSARAIRESDLPADAVERGQYRHFMLKEIHEQPRAIAQTLEERIAGGKLLDAAFGPAAGQIFKQVKAVHIAACGTSFHAGLVASYFIEQICRIPARIEIASEYRYRDPVITPDTLFVTISQSGETADTLAALRNAKQANYLSTAHHLQCGGKLDGPGIGPGAADRAGPEIGVASTKAFTTQLTALAMLTVALAKNGMAAAQEARPDVATAAIARPGREDAEARRDHQALAEVFVDKQHALFLGTADLLQAIAMEGALKLKEISYIHAEGYAAAELKHGPLALVDEDMPVVAVAPNNELLEKLKSNLQEVRARGGKLFVFADPQAGMHSEEGVTVIEMPVSATALQAPVVFAIPMQLLAYHVAVLKGTDVDQPRNLAKSLTVE